MYELWLNNVVSKRSMNFDKLKCQPRNAFFSTRHEWRKRPQVYEQ